MWKFSCRVGGRNAKVSVYGRDSRLTMDLVGGPLVGPIITVHYD